MKPLLISLALVASAALSSCETVPKPTPFVSEKQVMVPVIIDDAFYICPAKPLPPTQSRLGRQPTDTDLSQYILDLSKGYDTCSASLNAVKNEMHRQVAIIVESNKVTGASVSQANSRETMVSVVVVDKDGQYQMNTVTAIVE